MDRITDRQDVQDRTTSPCRSLKCCYPVLLNLAFGKQSRPELATVLIVDSGGRWGKGGRLSGGAAFRGGCRRLRRGCLSIFAPRAVATCRALFSWGLRPFRVSGTSKRRCLLPRLLVRLPRLLAAAPLASCATSSTVAVSPVIETRFIVVLVSSARIERVSLSVSATSSSVMIEQPARDVVFGGTIRIADGALDHVGDIFDRRLLARLVGLRRAPIREPAWRRRLSTRRAATRNLSGPTRSSSPSLSGTSAVIFSSLTWVPLRLPRSRTVYPVSRRIIAQ